MSPGKNDIILSPRDRYLIMMEKARVPAGQVRDYYILSGITYHIGIE